MSPWITTSPRRRSHFWCECIWFKMWKLTYPKNLVPCGPSSMIRLARASPSFTTGGWSSFSFLINLHKILVGMDALPGGMTNLIPLCRVPRIAPPRASTIKLTRKLRSIIVILNMYKFQIQRKSLLLYSF